MADETNRTKNGADLFHSTASQLGSGGEERKRGPGAAALWRTGWMHLADLFRWEKTVVARFIATSLGSAVAGASVFYLVEQFLLTLSGGHGLIGGTRKEPGLLINAVQESVGDARLVWVMAAILVATYVFQALLTYDNQVTQQRIVKVLETGMGEKLIRHLLTLSVPFFDRQTHGDIIQAVRQDITQLRMVILSIANLFLETAKVLALLVMAIKLSPWLTLWGLIVLPIALLPILLMAKRTLERSFKVRKHGYVLFDLVLQVLTGIRVIKAYGLERKQTELSVSKTRAYFDQVIEITRVKSMSTVMLEAMAGLGVVVVIVVGGMQIHSGALEFATLTSFILIMRQLQGPLNNMHTKFVEMQANGASVQRIAELLRAQAEICDRPDAARLPDAPRTIAFDAVSFAYREKRILDRVSFEVPAGSTIGIVGPSGGGKSTLLNLIVRFYDPTEGRVLFDGRDLREVKLRDVYDKIAIVMQEPYLFPASVRDNIRCARPSASDEEVEAAAKAAYVHHDIVALPKGYDTAVGTGGQGLSGGQRQRINIARALLKNAPILLLDEATSALDSVAEAQVQKAIDRLMEGRTSFVIAHRLSTLRNADKLLVMDKGRVAGFGTHEELLRSCPLYRSMWETQMVGGGAAGAARAA